MKSKNTKSLLIVGIIAILILLTWLVLSLNNKEDLPKQEVYTQENINDLISNPASETGFVVPVPLEDTSEEIVSNNEEGVIAGNATDYPEPSGPIDFRPESGMELKEQIIKIGSLGFEPKEIGAIYPSKVKLSFEAIDNNVHHIVFADKALAFLTAEVSKDSGAVGKTFISPPIGEYSFYIDDENNKGVFRVSAE